MLIIGLLIIGLLSRIIPHAPNFTPIIAIALFSGTYLNKKYSLLIPFALYVISDLIIGLHGVVLFTWSSVIIIAALGQTLKKNKSFLRLAGYTLASSVFFFIITNFGVWLTGWYPKTYAGLVQCYTLAIPFFRVSLAGNLIYVTVLFGIYQFVLNKLKDKKVKTVLLLS